MLLNPTKCQDYSLYLFWAIKGKLSPTPTPSPTQIRVNTLELKIDKGTDYFIDWKSKGVYNSKFQTCSIRWGFFA